MRSSQLVLAALAACFCAQFPAWSATIPSATIKSGSMIEVKIDHQVRMRRGKPVVAHTVYPLYLDNRLVLPAGTEVKGRIAQLRPVSRKTRLDALQHADFTPLHQAVLSFDSFVLPNGANVPVQASTSRGGIDVVRFDTRPPKPNAAYHRPSRARRLLSQFTAQEKAMVSGYAGLRKWPRLKRFIFSELPLHPQYVDAGLQYTVRLSLPLTLPFADAPPIEKQDSKTGDSLQHAAIVSA
ncbi:MAG TPA: hypothetical protein VFU27_05185, partial [Terriglobales bacterium]|nr:hypothetical protein [Terriglobales bacterium]